MKCWHCKHELRWHSDYCGAEVLITLEDKEIENDTSE